MKVKTSITLSEDVLEQLDDVAGSESRSALIERILRAFLQRRALDAVQARDRALLDREADVFNAEALDVLEYQAPWLEIDV
jgi:predicted transcriptional regulator